MIEAARIQAAFRGYTTRRITRLALQQFAWDCVEIEAIIVDEDPSYTYHYGQGLSSYLGYVTMCERLSHARFSRASLLFALPNIPARTCQVTARFSQRIGGATMTWRCTKRGLRRCEPQNALLSTTQQRLHWTLSRKAARTERHRPSR